jgi:hypothetical protein
MKTQILGCIVGLGVVACSLTSCTEPQPFCLVEDASAGPYSVVYAVSGTAPTCAGPTVLPGEQVGMSFYHPLMTNSDGSTTFNANISHVAIQANMIGNDDEFVYGAVGVADITPGDEPYAVGIFKSPSPDANNLCYVVTDSNNFTFTPPNGTSSVAVSVKDNMVATQNLAATTDTGALIGLGAPCGAPADCGFCAGSGATCTADTDCCSANCTGGTCGAPAMGTMPATSSGLTCDTTASMCTFSPCDPTNMDGDCGSSGGLICDSTSKACVLGCRGMMGNGCDAPYECSSSDATAGTCGLPQDTIVYTWSNLQIYTTAAAQGTQFSADVTISQTVGGAACPVSYKAIGMWPAVGCADQNGMPSDDLCNPCAEPSNGRALGSGINFNFPTHCDPVLLTCTLGVADGSYKVDAGLAAKGQLSVTGFTNATSIPQLLPDGDARIPICQGE